MRRAPYPFSAGGGGSNPVICGRKFCSACGCWRLVVDFACCRRDPPFKLASWCRICQRVRERERRRDPVLGELHREYQRIWAEGRRRAAGVPERRWVNGRQLPNEAHQGWTLNTEPVAAVVRQWLRTEVGRSLSDLALAAGVPERRIYDVLHGERISVPVADRLVVAMGLHLDLLYEEAA